MVNSHGRFLWYELMTTDTKAAKAFYAKVMGWEPRDASRAGDALHPVHCWRGDGLRADGPAAGGRAGTGAVPKWIGYVGVDDVDAAADRVKRLGGTVHVPPTDVPGISRFSVVTDPQGTAYFVLCKWRAAR